LNVDYKILTEVIAKRIEKVLPTLINRRFSAFFSFSTLESQLKSVALLELEEEFDLAYQAMSIVHKYVGVERERERTEEFASRLDSPDVPLEISETHEAKEGVVSYPAPISCRQAGKCRK